MLCSMAAVFFIFLCLFIFLSGTGGKHFDRLMGARVGLLNMFSISALINQQTGQALRKNNGPAHFFNNRKLRYN